jgi:hypothetical protein
VCTADRGFTGGTNDIGADTDFIGACTPALTQQVQHHDESAMILQQDDAPPCFHKEIRACREAIVPGKWIGRGERVVVFLTSTDVILLDSRNM